MLKNSNKSFTIVELLVVMAIIGILLTLAVVGIQQLQKQQRETNRINDLRNLQAQLESYYARYKKYPFANQSNSYVVLDNTSTVTSPDIGYCLNTAVNVACDVSSTTQTNNFVKVKISQLGLWSNTSVGNGVPYSIDPGFGYDTYNCPSIGSGEGEASADYWQLIYATKSVNGQSYTLFMCTENGKSQNLGTY